MVDAVLKWLRRFAFEDEFGLSHDSRPVVFVDHPIPEIRVSSEFSGGIAGDGLASRPMNGCAGTASIHFDGVNVIGRRCQQAAITKFAFVPRQLGLLPLDHGDFSFHAASVRAHRRAGLPRVDPAEARNLAWGGDG
jgi:hypothetical protein